MKITYFLNYFDLQKSKLKVGKSLEEVMQFVNKAVTKDEKKSRRKSERMKMIKIKYCSKIKLFQVYTDFEFLGLYNLQSLKNIAENAGLNLDWKIAMAYPNQEFIL